MKMSVNVAMSNTGSNGKVMTMGAAHSRNGPADTGAPRGTDLADREMSARMHFPEPSNRRSTGDPAAKRAEAVAMGLPEWYNNYEDFPVSYNTDSPGKEYMRIKGAVRAAAAAEAQRNASVGAVPRPDPITDAEVQYVKSMKDMAELAKFDDYVSRFIDPRKPGNMKWLMEIYPDFVERRLQQAHTDYEFALRNQMIDSWGISTFDDLHFKYLVDQGKISGPKLTRPLGRIDDKYTPGYLSPYNLVSPQKGGNRLGLPFTSAQHGARPPRGSAWESSRDNMPLGQGNDDYALAAGMLAAGDGYSGPNNQNPAGELRNGSNETPVVPGRPYNLGNRR